MYEVVVHPCDMPDWNRLRKKMFLLYLPHLGDVEAAEIFGYKRMTAREYRSQLKLHRVGNPWKDKPPLLSPSDAVQAGRMHITGVSLNKISNKFYIGVPFLTKLFEQD